MTHLPGLAASALTLTLQWTDSEQSRDSWSRTTTIRATADEVIYAEDVRGSIRRHAGPVHLTVQLGEARGVTTVEAGPEGSAPPEMTMTPAERIAAFKEASDAPPKPAPTVHDDPVVKGCSALVSAVRQVAKPLR
jgi:hypothetical protein